MLNKTYSTRKCQDHYINIINIWDNFNKMVLYNWFLWSRVHIQNTHCMAKGCIEIQKRFKLLSDGKRSIISLSTSKVHDSILRKFVFLFFGCRGHTYRSESAGFGKLKGIFIMCIYCMEANKCPNDCFFLVTEKLLLKSLLDTWCWNLIPLNL